nr:MAG TPA: hypothetical protein [Inoviridae sp.]
MRASPYVSKDCIDQRKIFYIFFKRGIDIIP